MARLEVSSVHAIRLLSSCFDVGRHALHVPAIAGRWRFWALEEFAAKLSLNFFSRGARLWWRLNGGGEEFLGVLERQQIRPRHCAHHLDNLSIVDRVARIVLGLAAADLEASLDNRP